MKSKRISFTCDQVPEKAKALILEVLESRQFSPGPKVRKFEEELAQLHGTKHAIFVNSGTDALRLSLLAMKEKYRWPDGSLVAVPALTFVATVNVILQANLEPFFVDVGMIDYTLNPWNLERRTGDIFQKNRIKAVMPVQLFGQECDPYLYELCKRNKWRVLEDSCETILNPVKGEIGCHSTYMAHHLTTGVGGFALTNDDKLNLIIRSLANHGRDEAYLPGYRAIPMSRDLLKRRFRFERVGYSCRPTEFEAALGLAQLDGLEEAVIQRQRVAVLLTDLLQDVPHLQLPHVEHHSTHTFMMFPIVLKDADKYDVCLSLEQAGIETRDMMPITTQPCYAKYFPKGFSGFSVAKEINEHGFYIPCHQGMTEDDVAYIQDVLLSYFVKRSVSVKAA